MPTKPGTSNTLLSLPKRSSPTNDVMGLVKNVAGAIPRLVTPFGGKTNNSQQSQMGANLPKPQMVANINTGQQQQPAQTAIVKSATEQQNTSQSLPPQKDTSQVFTTPSGAQVNAGTGALVSQPFNGFSGLVGQLAGTSAAGSTPAQQYTQQLGNQTQPNTDIGNKASDIASTYGQKIADVGQMGAQFQAGQRTTGTNPVAEGNAAVTAQTTAAQQSALAAGEEAALKGTGQQLTAQQQAQNALNDAGGLANTSQGLVQSGLNNAAGLAAPQPYGITNTPFYPTQGNQTGQFGTLPGGGAGAFGAGQVQGQVDLGQQYTQMSAANQAAKGIQSSVVQYLQANPTLNPTDATFGNAILQWAQGKQLGDARYQTLANYLNEYISTIAPILGVGGDTTNLKTEIAQSMINGRASGQSISDVISNLSALADSKLQNIKSSVQGGGVSTAQTGGTGGSIFSW